MNNITWEVVMQGPQGRDDSSKKKKDVMTSSPSWSLHLTTSIN
jgi:hypothetical protein